jgi:hypothetical protein
MIKIHLTILIILFNSCSKFNSELIKGKEISIKEGGLYEFNCYNKGNYFSIDNKLYICINMPDSLNSHISSFYNYYIDYRILNSNQSCNGQNGSFQLNQIELYNAVRK